MKTQSLLSAASEFNSGFSTTNSRSLSEELLTGRHQDPITFLLRGARVLIVDDSDDNQRLFTRVLEASGAEVHTASNGIEAIKAVVSPNAPKFDAIVMDIQMPQLDGNQATRVIRSFGYLGPIIALTAHGSLSVKDYSFQCGCSHFYEKPITRMQLVQAVASALSNDTVAISG